MQYIDRKGISVKFYIKHHHATQNHLIFKKNLKTTENWFNTSRHVHFRKYNWKKINSLFSHFFVMSQKVLWRPNPTKWSNALQQFVGCCRRIVWVCENKYKLIFSFRPVSRREGLYYILLSPFFVRFSLKWPISNTARKQSRSTKTYLGPRRKCFAKSSIIDVWLSRKYVSDKVTRKTLKGVLKELTCEDFHQYETRIRNKLSICSYKHLVLVKTCSNSANAGNWPLLPVLIRFRRLGSNSTKVIHRYLKLLTPL